MNAHTRDAAPSMHEEGPGKTARVMVWADRAPQQVEMKWGMRPLDDGDGRPISLLRAEGREFNRRCLIIANELWLRPGTLPNNKRRKVELITSAPFFCFAGTWKPAQSDWPDAFAGITVEAYPDIAPHQDRHMAIVHEEDWIDWLQGPRPADAILRSFPLGSFRASEPPPERPTALGDLFS